MNKRKIYFIFKKYATTDNLRLFLLSLSLIIILILNKGNFNTTDFFDLSILSAFGIIVVSNIVEKAIQKHASKLEDNAKLAPNYEKLLEKYSCSNLISYKGTTYPEEKLWMRSGNEKFVFYDKPEKFYNLPQQIADNSKELMEAHKASTIYNQISIRLDDFKFEPENEQIILKTSRTLYFDSLLTNRVADYTFGNRKTTIRELYEPGPYIKPLSISKMSNHLGFNGFVLTNDGKIPFILRKNKLSIAKEQWSTPVSASLKTKYALQDNSLELSDFSLANTIKNEIKDELNLTDDFDSALNLPNIQNSIFAFYRDLVECGKPQFLFYLKLNDANSETLEKRISQNKNKKDTTVDGYEVLFWDIDDLKKADFHIDKIIVSGNEYKMMPSAVASVILLLEHIANEEKNTTKN